MHKYSEYGSDGALAVVLKRTANIAKKLFYKIFFWSALTHVNFQYQNVRTTTFQRAQPSMLKVLCTAHLRIYFSILNLSHSLAILFSTSVHSSTTYSSTRPPRPLPAVQTVRPRGWNHYCEVLCISDVEVMKVLGGSTGAVGESNAWASGKPLKLLILQCGKHASEVVYFTVLHYLLK